MLGPLGAVPDDEPLCVIVPDRVEIQAVGLGRTLVADTINDRVAGLAERTGFVRGVYLAAGRRQELDDPDGRRLDVDHDVVLVLVGLGVDHGPLARLELDGVEHRVRRDLLATDADSEYGQDTGGEDHQGLLGGGHTVPDVLHLSIHTVASREIFPYTSTARLNSLKATFGTRYRPGCIFTLVRRAEFLQAWLGLPPNLFYLASLLA